MSVAFKIFLLMLLTFGGIWAWHFRAREIEAWLELGSVPALEGGEILPGSAVDRVFDPQDGPALLTARARYRPPTPSQPRRSEAAAPLEAEAVPAIVEERLERPEPAASPATGDEPEREPERITFLNPGNSSRGSRTPEGMKKPDGVKKPEGAKKSEGTAKDGAEREAPVNKGSGKEPRERGTPSIAQGIAAGENREGAAKDGPKPDRPAKEGSGKGKPERARDREEKGGAKSRESRTDPHAPPAEGRRQHPASGGDGVAEDSTTAPKRVKMVSHVVKQHETLASLARLYYQDDTESWRRIYAANQERIADPDSLSPGITLEIPNAVIGRRSSDRAGSGEKSGENEETASRKGSPRSAAHSASNQAPPRRRVEENQ